jgi:hypothetical protein
MSIIARLSLGANARRSMACAAVAAVLLAGSIGWGYSQNRQLISWRLYEISHRYKGVLDFVIPYLRERYERPERLVIATNYEETSYIYYLGCRVIIGFLNPDMLQDLMERPDCLIYRRSWAVPTYDTIFSSFLARNAYEQVRFPVVDYAFNNIPETVHWTPQAGWKGGLHLFRTLTSDVPGDQTTIFIRRPDAASGLPAQDPSRP